MTVELRPGKKQHVDPGPDWGVRVIEPGPQAAAGGGWWDDFGAIGCCVGAWAGRGAASYAASLLDLSGNGNNLAEIGGPPGWNAVQGWFNFAALNRCLDTGLTPANDASWSVLIQFANDTTPTKYLIGMSSGATRSFGIAPDWGGASVLYENGKAAAWAPGLLVGNLGISNSQSYRNGALDTNIGVPWGGVAAHTIYIGARNNVGAAIWHTSADIWAVSVYDCTLTAPQMLAMATAMAAL